MCDVEDDFIGKMFPTPKGGVLTVRESNGLKGNKKKYVLECSVCSKDEELWPYGSISTIKSNILKGIVPCECSKSSKLKRWQYEIKLHRVCNNKNVTFKNFIGDWNGAKSSLLIQNNIDKSLIEVMSLSTFLMNPFLYNMNIDDGKPFNLITDKSFIEEFYSSGFDNKYYFWRKGDGWDYMCPYCSNDEYVQNGLCSGIFGSSLSNLKKGIKSCRCSKAYRWTKEQREYQINKQCILTGFDFIGWEESTYKSKSYIKVCCNMGHEYPVTLERFLHGVGCRECYKDNIKSGSVKFGLYSNRLDEEDTLYILDFGKYLKVGRSFNLDKRLKELSFKSGTDKKRIKIVGLYRGIHRIVYDTEQNLHSILESEGYRWSEDRWSIELFNKQSISLIKDILLETDLISDNTL
ncbi:endonuclease [Vibrio phage qdvp001]|uniref:endonuclease n=1 Tax=Vibrio phage qdvp001 TaxID=1003177 RepID=UPI000722D9C0|nr:endonuclease [Vibrio phage qdvp001]ALM62195.1 hypothetical protein qdvp001_203 [Vibrio phage qdvp001]